MKKLQGMKFRLTAAAIVAFAAFGVRAALPDGYVELAYIEGTGTQWIDTSVVPDSTTTLTAEYQLTDWSKTANAYVFGVWADDNCGRMQFAYKLNVSPNTLFLGYGVSYDNSSVTCSPDTNHHTVELNGATFYLDGEKLSPTKPNTRSGSTAWSWRDGGKRLYLFACNQGGTAGNITPLRLYSCKIWKGGALLRDFVPCRNSEGKVGLLDIAQGHNMFYQNKASSGADFTPGPLKESGIIVTGSPAEYGAPSPAYGFCADVTVGEQAEFDCPAFATGAAGSAVCGCDGWTLVPGSGEGLSGDGTNAVFTYEARMSGAVLTWLWSERYYRVKVEMPDGKAPLVYEPAPDYTNEVGDVFFAPGRQVRVVVAADDSPHIIWSNVGTGCSAEGNALTFTMGTEEVRATCSIRGRWHWDVAGKVLTNGVWKLTYSVETVGTVTGFKITSFSGSGVLDLTTFKEDTAGDAAAAKQPNYDVISIKDYLSSTTMTEFIAPAVIKCDNSSFENATALKRIVLSKDVRILNTKFCNGAKALKEFQPTNMPELETLGGTVFCAAEGLKGDFTAGKIKSIEGNAFRATGITSFSAPLATSVGGGALGKCYSITNISLPSVKSIYGPSISESAGSIKTLTVDGTVVTDLTGKSAFANIWASLPTNWPALKRVEPSSFASSTGIKGDVTIPQVPTLDSAFHNCTKITSVYAPKCTLWGNSAFAGCTALTNVTVLGCVGFPKTMPSDKAVGGAFSDATALRTLNWLAETAPTNLPAQAFSNGSLAKNGSPVIVRAKITPENRAQWERLCTTCKADLTDTHRKIANWSEIRRKVVGFIGTVSESSGNISFTAAGGNICWIVDSADNGLMLLVR